MSSGLPSYILDTEGSPLDEDENFERTLALIPNNLSLADLLLRARRRGFGWARPAGRAEGSLKQERYGVPLVTGGAMEGEQ